MIKTTTHENFIRALKFARAFAAKDDVRHYLNGVLVELCPNEMHVVGTDGHRLGFIEMSATRHNSVNETIVSVIIPNEDVDRILKTWALKKTSAFDVEICVEGLEFSIEAEGTRIKGLSIDAKYPDWRKVTAPDYLGPPKDKVFGINFNYLADALKACELISNDYKKVEMTAHKDAVSFFVSSPYVDTARVVIMQMRLS